ATSPGFFPDRRATCQQTALKIVGSKRETGRRPPRVTQPPVVQEGVHVDGHREIRAALEQHRELPPLRAITTQRRTCSPDCGGSESSQPDTPPTHQDWQPQGGAVDARTKP